jgi:hypothetical protein
MELYLVRADIARSRAAPQNAAMYLSAHQTDVLARTMATLAKPHAEREIRLRLGRLMLQLLGAQHCASCVWDEARQCFDGGVHLNMDPANLEPPAAPLRCTDTNAVEPISRTRDTVGPMARTVADVALLDASSPAARVPRRCRWPGCASACRRRPGPGSTAPW